KIPNPRSMLTTYSSALLPRSMMSSHRRNQDDTMPEVQQLEDWRTDVCAKRLRGRGAPILLPPMRIYGGPSDPRQCKGISINCRRDLQRVAVINHERDRQRGDR